VVVLLTDFADFPPHFWLEPGVDLAVVATHQAADQAAAAGIPEANVLRTSGLVLRPAFHAVDPGPARCRLREEMGFAADDLVVLLLFGGKGAPEMAPLARRLLEQSVDWRLLAVCGDNPRLEAALAPVAASSGGRLRILGFTDRVPELMAAADLLVTKPGPGSLAEAFHLRLPVVVVRDRRTVPQERFNTRLVEERGLGVVVRHWKRIPEAAAALARDATARERLRRSLASLPPNRAVHQVLDRLEALVGAKVGARASAGRRA
jgi:UDP-N-acetylglucosamine:LPS N-acetylglucosamine transferase